MRMFLEFHKEFTSHQVSRMHQRTRKVLADLEAVEWFRNIGMRDSDKVVFLSSWADAIRVSQDLSWKNLQLEATNRYRQRLIEKDKDCLTDWNSIVREMKKVVIPLVSHKIRKVVNEQSLSEDFTNTVNWDVLHLCMESEYAEIYPPGFYAAQAFWYVGGHFPCGWTGDFPQGLRLVI